MKKKIFFNINDKKCAPSKKYLNGSCFTLNNLKIIAQKYNEKNDDKININASKEELVKELEIKFSNDCSDQICWLRLDLIKNLNNDDIKLNTFRPFGPKKKYDWLSTTDINKVIEQYQFLHKNFLFLGAVPYDFEDLAILGLNNLNFKQLEENGKTKLGMVINLDNHDESGSHWVSLYFDLDNYQIYYFDSVGKKPYKRIKQFINKITKYLYFKKFKKKLLINKLIKKKNINSNDQQLNNLLNGIDIKYNNIQHQFKDSECGVYSINVITRLVEGENFDLIMNNIKKDEEMNKFRSVYFNNIN
jgi:hypothetical protein